MKIFRLCLPLLCSTAALGAADPDQFLRAIRANDLKSLKTLCQEGVTGVRDRLDWTPLHYAALYGGADSVRILLEAGADPNARNSSQATPLIYAAYSLEKTRLLVEKGGDVNAKSDADYTALWVASGAPGNGATMRYLIERAPTRKKNDPRAPII